jgi:hypothetical protein
MGKTSGVGQPSEDRGHALARSRFVLRFEVGAAAVGAGILRGLDAVGLGIACEALRAVVEFRKPLRLEARFAGSLRLRRANRISGIAAAASFTP